MDEWFAFLRFFGGVLSTSAKDVGTLFRFFAQVRGWRGLGSVQRGAQRVHEQQGDVQHRREPAEALNRGGIIKRLRLGRFTFRRLRCVVFLCMTSRKLRAV